jgi:conjugative transposon TraN protein
MKKIFGWVALLVGMVTGANAQVNDTIQRTTGNDLYQGITRKLPYRQMVTPHGVQVTFAKTVHIIFPSAVRYVDLGSNWIIAGKADGAENVIRVKAATEGFPGETNFSVICEDGSFYSFNARYAHEPEMLNIEMKDFLENGDTTDFSHTRMNIHFRELAGESPLLVKLIMQSIYKEDRREIRHLGCKRFGVQFLLKSVHSHNGLFYFHTETRNRSNVAFRTDFIRFKIVDKKVPKRTAIQERVIDPVRSYNEVLVTEGKSDSHTRMNIHFRELAGESPLLVKLIMQSIYKEDRREIRHLGCKRFGVQFLLKSVHSHNGLFYFHTETRNRSNVAFRTDFIRFKIVDKKVPKRTAIQERVIDPVRSYNEVLVTEGKSDVRTVYAVPQFTIPDDKLLVIELFEKDGGRHQTIRVENADLVAARQINELKIK